MARLALTDRKIQSLKPDAKGQRYQVEQRLIPSHRTPPVMARIQTIAT